DNASMSDEAQRFGQMMDKADQDQSQALATGIGDIAVGALGATSGFRSDGRSAAGADDTNWRAVTEGAGKVMPGVGTIVAGGYKADADRDDARASLLEAQAQMEIRRHDGARDEAESASDSISKVQDLLQSLQQTTNETRSTA